MVTLIRQAPRVQRAGERAANGACPCGRPSSTACTNSASATARPDGRRLHVSYFAAPFGIPIPAFIGYHDAQRVSGPQFSVLSPFATEGSTAVVRTAEVIVVGGGVNGTSTAFHLAERGIKVTLIDRAEIAGASTGKSGGLVRMHYTNPYEARLANESLPYFREWRHRVGIGDPGFARTGFIQTVSPRNVPALHENVRMLQGIGVNTCIVNGEDVRRMQPWVDTDDLIACAYEPDSGCAMPGDTARSFAQAAERHGAEIVTGTAVTALRTESGRVIGVSTDAGDFDA